MKAVPCLSFFMKIRTMPVSKAGYEDRLSSCRGWISWNVLSPARSSSLRYLLPAEARRKEIFELSPHSCLWLGFHGIDKLSIQRTDCPIQNQRILTPSRKTQSLTSTGLRGHVFFCQKARIWGNKWKRLRSRQKTGHHFAHMSPYRIYWVPAGCQAGLGAHSVNADVPCGPASILPDRHLSTPPWQLQAFLWF